MTTDTLFEFDFDDFDFDYQDIDSEAVDLIMSLSDAVGSAVEDGEN